MKKVTIILIIGGILQIISTATASDINNVPVMQILQGVLQSLLYFGLAYISEFIRMALK